MKNKFTLVIFFSIFMHLGLAAQAGTSVYSFLDLPVSSKMTALGGSNISLKDNDLNFAFRNPALLSGETGNMIAVNIANYLADIKFGSAMYSYNLDKKNFFAVGVQYIDYGTFDGRDELDNETGTFTAKDMSLNLMYARPLTNRITIGGTLKPVYSSYERYSSYGIALDAGVSYNDSAKLFSAGLVFRNAGTQIKGYYSDENGQHYESLPFDIELGLTKKLAHAPFRFSITLNNLQHWNLDYQSTNTSSSSDTETEDSDPGFFDMAFRHTIIGLEFLPGKSFYLAAAYNYRRQAELSMDGFKSMAGFSFGGGIKLYKFQVGFGMSQFQVGNYAYMFSIGTSLNDFKL